MPPHNVEARRPEGNWTEMFCFRRVCRSGLAPDNYCSRQCWGARGTVIGHTGVAVSRARFTSQFSWEKRISNNFLLGADQSTLNGPSRVAASAKRKLAKLLPRGICASVLLRLSSPRPDESNQRRVRTRSLEFCLKSLGQCAEIADRIARNTEILKSRSHCHE